MPLAEPLPDADQHAGAADHDPHPHSHADRHAHPAPPTNTATNTPTPGETCVPGVPTRVATPAFTPRSGCSDTPPAGDLDGSITVNPSTVDVLITNHSTTCSYRVGLAVYKKYDENIDNQELYDYTLAVIPPNSVLQLTVDAPPCAYQADPSTAT